jgi:hypothetical protein
MPIRRSDAIPFFSREREATIAENRVRRAFPEEDLFLPHPDPARIEHESPAFVEKRFLVLSLESFSRGAEESERAVSREGGNE